MAMPNLAGWDAVDQLDAADLDDAVTVEAGSSPVVSVSSTISRKSFIPWSLEVPQPLNDAALPASSNSTVLSISACILRKARAAVHNVVGPRALLSVGKLTG